MLTFNEPVLAGAGNIEVLSMSGGASRTIAVTDPDTVQVAVAGSTLTAAPSGGPASGATGAEYEVRMASGVVTDDSAARNPYAGLAATAWAVAIADTAAPVLRSTAPGGRGGGPGAGQQRRADV